MPFLFGKIIIFIDFATPLLDYNLLEIISDYHLLKMSFWFTQIFASSQLCYDWIIIRSGGISICSKLKTNKAETPF